jgi:RimJ/RimL family protein N-acetyltransferase
MLRVRKCRDLELIERLDKQIFGEDSETACAGKYDSPKCTWWVAWDGEEPAGFAGLRTFSEAGEQHGYLNRAGVVKAYRGQGLQKALIRVRASEARRLGLTMIVTYTERYNYPSANSLARCGFQLYTPKGPWGLKDALYFRKILTK